MLRLNMAIPPTRRTRTRSASSAATWPASRTAAASPTTSSTIELQAIAGATYPLVAPTYTPDGAAGLLTEQPFSPASPGADRYLPAFPYVGNAARRLQHAVAV